MGLTRPYDGGDESLLAAYEARYERTTGEPAPRRTLDWWRERDGSGMTEGEVLAKVWAAMNAMEGQC